MKLFNERETLEGERGLPGTCVYMLLLTHVVQAIALEGQILYIVCGMCMFVCMCTCVYVCVCMCVCVCVWFEGDNILSYHKAIVSFAAIKKATENSAKHTDGEGSKVGEVCFVFLCR